MQVSLADNELILPADLPGEGIDLGDRQRSRLEKNRRFPRRVFISAKKYAYVKSEIRKYIADKIAARDASAEAA